MKFINHKFLLLIICLLQSCTPSEFSQIAQRMIKTAGAEHCHLNIEKYVNLEGVSTKKVILEFAGVPHEQISSEQKAIAFLEQLALAFYHSVSDKSSLESYDGIEVVVKSTKDERVDIYLQFKEIEIVYKEMRLLESVLDEIIIANQIDWTNNLFHSSMNDSLKTELDRFIQVDLAEFGKIESYYIIRYKIMNTPLQKVSIVRYACETQKKNKFYMDFMFDYNTDQIIGILAHDGSKEFDLAE